MSGKRYPEEFKIEAVRQVVDRGYSVVEVADRLGTTTHWPKAEIALAEIKAYFSSALGQEAEMNEV